jgi:hypothetical protein
MSSRFCSCLKAFITIFSVLLGRDDEEIHVAARFLVDFIPAQQNVLFALSLKDYQPKTLRQIGEFLKLHPSLTAFA